MSWKQSPGPIARTVALLLCLGSSGAVAQDAPQLRIDMQVEKEVTFTDSAGVAKVQREPVQAAAVGDVLVYTLAIANDGDRPAHNARVVDPVPAGTILIPESGDAGGSQVTYSIDGGSTFAVFPITRPVAGPDGRTIDQPVPVEEYTHVRWTLTEPLAPGQVRTANFKVRVR